MHYMSKPTDGKIISLPPPYELYNLFTFIKYLSGNEIDTMVKIDNLINIIIKEINGWDLDLMGEIEHIALATAKSNPKATDGDIGMVVELAMSSLKPLGKWISDYHLDRLSDIEIITITQHIIIFKQKQG